VIEEEGAEAGEEALRNAAMAPLRPLMVMAENFKDPANLLTFIQKMKAANEKAQKKTPDSKEDWKEPAVLIGTVHGWKGLEAKHVYVCMAGGVFPNFKTDDKASNGEAHAYDEERRLAYVAITRGENSVTVVSPQASYLGKPSAMSRFVSEACIQVAGEPQDDTDSAQIEEDLTRADPKQTEAGWIQDENESTRMASTKMESKFAQALIACMGGCGESPVGQTTFDFEEEIPEDLMAQLDIKPKPESSCGCSDSGSGGVRAEGQPCTCGGAGCSKGKSATVYDYGRS
jgi:hypothetical protein